MATYAASITAWTEHADHLLQLLKVEEREGENDRASFHVEKKQDSIIIAVNADDSVALRATMVSLTKVLTIHEKIDRFGEQG